MDCNDATRFYSSMQVNWLSGYCESQEDGAYRKYTIKDNYNRLPTATPTVAPSGPSMAPVVTPSPSAAPTPYSAKRCSDAQTRSIVMGADAYFNDSSAWMHYYPADTCVGEEDDTVYRCSDDGYMLYRYLFAEAGCSGSASVQVLNVTAGAAEVGSNFFVDCSCSSESNHYIEARAFADSNCTSECGSESAYGSCNSSVATFLSGTVVQMVVSGNSYNDDDSMDWTYGGNSSYGG